MTPLQEKIKNWIESEPSQDTDCQSTLLHRIDSIIEAGIFWSMRRLLPVLIITLIIDMAIMFTVPIEVTMTKYFWIKDPLSLALAYLLCPIPIRHGKN